MVGESSIQPVCCYWVMTWWHSPFSTCRLHHYFTVPISFQTKVMAWTSVKDTHAGHPLHSLHNYYHTVDVTNLHYVQFLTDLAIQFALKFDPRRLRELVMWLHNRSSHEKWWLLVSAASSTWGSPGPSCKARLGTSCFTGTASGRRRPNTGSVSTHQLRSTNPNHTPRDLTHNDNYKFIWPKTIYMTV